MGMSEVGFGLEGGLEPDPDAQEAAAPVMACTAVRLAVKAKKPVRGGVHAARLRTVLLALGVQEETAEDAERLEREQAWREWVEMGRATRF